MPTLSRPSPITPFGVEASHRPSFCTPRAPTSNRSIPRLAAAGIDHAPPRALGRARNDARCGSAPSICRSRDPSTRRFGWRDLEASRLVPLWKARLARCGAFCRALFRTRTGDPSLPCDVDYDWWLPGANWAATYWPPAQRTPRLPAERRTSPSAITLSVRPPARGRPSYGPQLCQG